MSSIAAIYGVRIVGEKGFWRLVLDVLRGETWESPNVMPRKPEPARISGIFERRDDARLARAEALVLIAAGKSIYIADAAGNWRAFDTSPFKYTGRQVLRPIAVRQKAAAAGAGQ